MGSVILEKKNLINLFIKAEQMSHSRIFDIISIGLSLVIWSMVPYDTGSIFIEKIAENMQDYFFSLPYERALEKEADTVGMILSARACFDVRKNSEFWQRMNDLDKDKEVPEFLSTHPSNINRAQDLINFLPKVYFEILFFEIKTNFLKLKKKGFKYT